MLEDTSRTEFEQQTNMASNKVLGIGELIEMVLLQLPCRDVLLAQRVSRTWHATISESLKLQKALFIVPCHAPLYGADVDLFPGGKSSAIQHMMNGTVLLEPSSEITAYEVSALGCSYEDIILNPLLQHLFPFDKYFAWTSFSFRKAQNLDHPKASWKRMLTTQPPVLDMDILCRFPGSDFDRCTWKLCRACDFTGNRALPTIHDVRVTVKERLAEKGAELMVFGLMYKKVVKHTVPAVEAE